MEKSRSSRRGGGGGGSVEGIDARRGDRGHAEKVDWLSLQAMVLEFTKTTQRKLERERAGLLVQCTASEEKAARLESYVSTHLLAYQKEIIQLRHRNELLERQIKGGPR
jgi:cell division protein FtsB